jgi:hypothetical protein
MEARNMYKTIYGNPYWKRPLADDTNWSELTPGPVGDIYVDSEEH